MRAAGFFAVFSIIVLAALLPWRADAVSVTLGWYPSATPDVAGYNIRYGLESGNYTFKVSTGTNTSGTVSGLIEGMTYYFVVTVHTSSGIESDPSNEVGYTVPGIATPGNPWLQTDPAGGLPVLKWKPSPSPNVAGYHVYYGTASGSYPQLIFSGNATTVSLSSLAQATNGYYVVTAYDDNGQESAISEEITSSTSQPNSVGIIPAPVLSLKRTPAFGLPNVFAISAAGAIPPSWAIEASSDLRTWGTVTAGSNSAVNVTVVVTPKNKMFFRLDSALPGIQLKTQNFPGSFPNSFSVATSESTPSAWAIQTSDDLQTWNGLTSGTNADVNLAVIPSKSTAVYFRLKSR